MRGQTGSDLLRHDLLVAGRELASRLQWLGKLNIAIVHPAQSADSGPSAPQDEADYNCRLFAPDQLNRIGVVLVAPRNPLNIGAAARAMANFGFSRLSVAAPYAPNWREARSAVGAPQLLKDAREFATLSEAVADCTLVAGTGTLERRKPEQPVVPLPDLAPLLRQELEHGGRVALVFGSEKHGLTREDLSYCHILVEIPTDPRQPSMNLGQAVAVCLYELASRIQFPSRATSLPPQPPRAAGSGSLDRLAGVIEEAMLAAHYSPASMRQANRRDLRLLLRRMSLNDLDVRRILGLFRKLLWRLRHPIGRANPERGSDDSPYRGEGQS
jgi:tRNA/rRNA methyltransferase